MKQGSEGGSEESEDYLSASDERGTPNLQLRSQVSSPLPQGVGLPLSHHMPYRSIKSENQGIALPATSTPPNNNHSASQNPGAPATMMQTMTTSLAANMSFHGVKTESQGASQASSTPPPCTMSQHPGIQHPAIHPIPTALASGHTSLKSPSLGQSPPLLHGAVSAPPSPMTSLGIMTSASSMTSPEQLSPYPPMHKALPANGSDGYHRITGQGMTLPLTSPVPPACSNSSNYSQGSYINSGPKLTHL